MEELIGYLKEIKSDVDYENETHLVTDGFLRSFDMIQIVNMIKDKYGLKIPIADLKPWNFDSVQAMFDMIERLMDE